MIDHNQFLQIADVDGLSPQKPPLFADGAAAAAQAGSWNTAAHYVGDTICTAIAFNCAATGTPVGTVKLQVSLDRATNQQVGPQFPDAGLANWADVLIPTTGIATVAVSGATTGPVIWVLKWHPYRWVRLVYARTSGAITPLLTIQNKK